MTIVASCGHTLNDSDGEDGMGHMLAIKGLSRECRPAVHYGSYCSKCRDQLMSEPGMVLHTEEDEIAWCRSS